MVRKLITPLSFVYIILVIYAYSISLVSRHGFGMLCIPVFVYWAYLMITRLRYSFLYVASVTIIYWIFAFPYQIFGVLMMPPILYWSYLIFTKRPVTSWLVSPLIVFVIWLHPIFLKSFVDMVSNHNNYTEIALKNQASTTIDVTQPLPFEWNYAVLVKIELIDGEDRIFSPAKSDRNFREEFYNIVGLHPTTEHPIKFEIRGYKLIDQEKIPFYRATLHNGDAYAGSGAYPANKKNYAKKSVYGDILNLAKGKYIFEIVNISRNQQVFDDYKAYINITPNTMIH